MRRFSIISLSLAAMTLLATAPLARAANVVTDVTKFNGTVTDVGVVRGPGQTGGVEYRIHGEFVYPGPLDLANSSFTMNQFFFEPDSATVPLPAGKGGGELMRASQGPKGPDTDPLLAPITLDASHAEDDDVKYDTPGRFRPQIRAKIDRTVDDGFAFDVRLDRGMMRVRPSLCAPGFDGRSRTLITTSFTINDETDPAHSLTVTFTKSWECVQPDRYHMRSR